MSRYEELCETLEQTRYVCQRGRSEFEKTFIQKLCEYLGCPRDCISIRFGEPVETASGAGIVWQFDIQVVMNAPTQTETVLIPNFNVLYHIEEGRHTVSCKDEYVDEMARLDEDLSSLFDIIFDDLKIYCRQVQ